MRVSTSLSSWIPAVTALLWLGACSSQALYGGGQQTQLQECRKLPDVAERGRCEQRASLSHERYQAELEAARRSGASPPAAPK